MASSEYLAGPPGACCLKATLHKGEPRGTKIPIAGVDTYIARPKDPGHSNGNIILYFPDVYGFWPNNFLTMDAMADGGYTVMALDYFRGDPVGKHRKDRNDNSDPSFDYIAWRDYHQAFADEVCPKWVKEVKEKHGTPSTKYACVGYCFGAPYVMNELAGDLVSAGAFGHPAFLKDHHFRNMKKPLLLSCAEIDHTFPAENRRKAVDMMIEDKKTFQVQLFSGVEHGFSLRGNMDVPYERYTKEQSLIGILGWFDFWLSQ